MGAGAVRRHQGKPCVGKRREQTTSTSCKSSFQSLQIQEEKTGLEEVIQARGGSPEAPSSRPIRQLAGRTRACKSSRSFQNQTANSGGVGSEWLINSQHRVRLTCRVQLIVRDQTVLCLPRPKSVNQLLDSFVQSRTKKKDSAVKEVIEG